MKAERGWVIVVQIRFLDSAPKKASVLHLYAFIQEIHLIFFREGLSGVFTKRCGKPFRFPEQEHDLHSWWKHFPHQDGDTWRSQQGRLGSWGHPVFFFAHFRYVIWGRFGKNPNKLEIWN